MFMIEFNEIFYKNLPAIDLHGLDRDSARVAIEDFVRDNYKQKNEYFVIVHGIGNGILKETTRLTLSKNKRVINFKIIYNNVGSTIVRISIWQIIKKVLLYVTTTRKKALFYKEKW